MTRTTVEEWIPRRAFVDKKNRQFKRVKHWIGYEHERVISAFDWLLESTTIPSTYHEDAQFIAPNDFGNELYGVGYGCVISQPPEKVKRYPCAESKEYLRYYTGSTLLNKTIASRPCGDFDAVFSVRFPVTGHAPEARLTGPIRFLVKLLETWDLTQEDGTTLLGLEATDNPYVRELFSGHAPLRGRDTKDRIACLFRIRKTLSALFRNEKVENDWLREPHDLLDGQAPMTLLLEGSMENLLLVKEYVEAAAGR